MVLEVLYVSLHKLIFATKADFLLHQCVVFAMLKIPLLFSLRWVWMYAAADLRERVAGQVLSLSRKSVSSISLARLGGR